MRMIPVGWLLLTIVAMWLADRYFPVLEYSLRWLYLSGRLLVAIGVGMFVAAAWQFRRHKTTVHPFGDATALITGGPFSISRNPVYLAMVLILCGGALHMGSVTPWLFIAVFAWVIQSQFIESEEQFLAAKFPDSYAAYCQRVRRWI